MTGSNIIIDGGFHGDLGGIAKLLIFDCNGVLVDSEPIAVRVASHVMIELALRVAGLAPLFGPNVFNT